MTRVRWRALLTGALAAAAALRLAWVVAAAGTSFDRPYHCGEGKDINVEAGHSLIHGLPHERVFRSMPAGTVANALACRRASPAAVLAAPSAALLLDGMLVFGLGGLLGGGPAGALALALFAFASDWPGAFGDRWLFTSSLLLVAFLAVWRARFPSTRKTALLAAAVGLSLNVLSVLFLLPPLLAAWEWRPGNGRTPRQRRVNAAILLAVPALLLLPWAFATWRVTGEPSALERGRSDVNVISGALGMTETVGPGAARALAGVADAESALVWASREVARHPLRFAAAVARRVRLAFSFQPLLLAAALLSLWALRRRPGAIELGGLLVYFLILHCLMPIEARYFTPLWPLAGAMAAGLAGLGRHEPGAPWARPLAACAFLPFAGLGAYALALVSAYPARSADPSAWEREASRGADQAWLQGELGRRHLLAGRPSAAVEALTRSLRRIPDEERAQLLAWAMMIRTGSRSGLAERLVRHPDPLVTVRQLVMEAMDHLRSGRPEAAARTMARAEAVQSRWSAAWRERADAATSDSLRSWSKSLIRYWPDQDRLAILAGIDDARGERRRRLRDLDFLDREEAMDAGAHRRVAEEYVRLGAPSRAVDILRGLASREPRDLDLRIDLALLAHAAGRSESARAALAEARALAREPQALRRVAEGYRATGDLRRASAVLASLPADGADSDDGAARARLHMEMKEYGESLRQLDALLRARPGDARLRNDRGVVLALMGREREAIDEFELALDADPGLASAAASLKALRERAAYARSRSAPRP